MPTTAAQATTFTTTHEAQHRAYLNREATTTTTHKVAPTTHQAAAAHHQTGVADVAAEVSLVAASLVAVSPEVEAVASLVEAVIVAKTKASQLDAQKQGL